MKRIFSLFVMFCCLAFSLNSMRAQTVVESKWYDNTFVGASVGLSYSFVDEPNAKFFKNLDPVVDVNLGKWFTPVVGAQINYEVGWAETPRTAFDHHNLSVDGLVNFSNLLFGYKGQSRKFEMNGLAGAGWYHSYGVVNNSPSVRVGLQMNFKLDKSDRWSINIEPLWTYLPDEGASVESSYISTSVGLTYRFKSSNGSHNFVIAKLYDQEEIDQLNHKINELRTKNEQLTNTVKAKDREIDALVIKMANQKTDIVKEYHSSVGFTIGQYSVSKVQLPILNSVAKQLCENPKMKINVIGYADANTGSPEVNLELSEKRAKEVKKILESYGVKSEQIITEWVGDTVQPFAENDMNRVALFISK